VAEFLSDIGRFYLGPIKQRTFGPILCGLLLNEHQSFLLFEMEIVHLEVRND